MSISYTAENYLKAIYYHTAARGDAVTTNVLAQTLNTSPAAVTDMVRKLCTKGLVVYKKYQGVNFSEEGRTQALQVIRRNLLWEVFLVEKLKFGWEEIHEVAEQLEHVQSSLLVQRLDDFLGNPAHGPHGQPIPNARGELEYKSRIVLTDMNAGCSGIVGAIKEGIPTFLQYLSKRGIYLGARIHVVEKIPFDQSIDISIDGLPKVNVSKKVSDNILVTP